MKQGRKQVCKPPHTCMYVPCTTNHLSPKKRKKRKEIKRTWTNGDENEWKFVVRHVYVINGGRKRERKTMIERATVWFYLWRDQAIINEFFFGGRARGRKKKMKLWSSSRYKKIWRDCEEHGGGRNDEKKKKKNHQMSSECKTLRRGAMSVCHFGIYKKQSK